MWQEMLLRTLDLLHMCTSHSIPPDIRRTPSHLISGGHHPNWSQEDTIPPDLRRTPSQLISGGLTWAVPGRPSQTHPEDSHTAGCPRVGQSCLSQYWLLQSWRKWLCPCESVAYVGVWALPLEHATRIESWLIIHSSVQFHLYKMSHTTVSLIQNVPH